MSCQPGFEFGYAVFPTCVDKSSFPSKTHLLTNKMGIMIGLLWPNTYERLKVAGNGYSLGRMVAVLLNIFKHGAFHFRCRSIGTTTLQSTGKSSQTTCLHLSMVLGKPVLSQNYLNLLKWGIKINKMKVNRDKCKYCTGDYYRGDLRLFFTWKEHENGTRQQTQDVLMKIPCPD